jgi:hypothetical protein
MENGKNTEIKKKHHHNIIARVLDYDNTGYFYRGSIFLSQIILLFELEN